MAKFQIAAVSVALAAAGFVFAEDKIAPPLPAEPAAPAPVARSTEEIILLPKMVVQGSSAPAFNERELLTQGGLNDLLMKRFPGATFKGQPAEMDNYGLLMYDDEKRRNALDRYEGFADVLRRTGDAAGSKELRDELHRTFIRSHDSKSERMDRTANGGRR